MTASPAGARRAAFRFQPSRFFHIARLNALWSRQSAGTSHPQASGKAKGSPKGFRSGAPQVELRSRRPSGLRGAIRPSIPLGDTIDRLGDCWEPLGDGFEALGDSIEVQEFNQPQDSRFQTAGLGYHADLPDIRDHTFDKGFDAFLRSSPRHSQLERVGAGQPGTPANPVPATPGFVHLRQFGQLPEIEHQGSMQSCTAHAVIGMAEILIQRYSGVPLDLSRLFLYKCTRRLLGWTGDTGAFVRTTIKALRLFGSLPESQWPYLPERLEDEPDAFIYAYAHSFRALEYARLDDYSKTPDHNLIAIRKTLDAGHPVAFGFPVFSSIEQIGTDYVIPIPRNGDGRHGGHAVLAVGYNDHLPIHDEHGTEIDQGALIIRNSWGTEWGDQGYAYLPYWYVRKNMAVDFWTLYGLDWLQELQFEVRSSAPSGRRR